MAVITTPEAPLEKCFSYSTFKPKLFKHRSKSFKVMMENKHVPSRHDLVSYDHAVAGHAGTMSDPDGTLFIKPCTQTELNFYQSANQRYRDFANIMPLFMGTLTLGENEELSTDESEADPESKTKKQAVGENDKKDNIEWKPSKSKKIETHLALVLQNSTAGFKKPNILDAKLGVRLWADDAPLQKKQRFDKISAETTHKNFGFRIAGMRIYKGAESESDLGDDGYKTYDKDYGRLNVDDDTLISEFRRFVFNSHAGISPHLAKQVCKGFVRDLERIEGVLSKYESRMYSASVLFVYEGDGDALEAAIQENNDMIEARYEKSESNLERTNARVDSGIEMEDDDFTSDEDEELPKIFTCRLIDFAHAKWTPGQGPDENSLKGVRSLLEIMRKLAEE